jgi:solute carrier family 34 (sodium-dependent phosphate cotransporter)
MNYKEIENEEVKKVYPKHEIIFRAVQIVFFIFIFFLSIHLLSIGFRSLGEDTIKFIIQATSNPFIGLFIGLLLTAIIQSSSTSTSIIVAIVASGTLRFENAIPLVMGANIGTTITSTIVSLGYITKKNEFKRAIAAGALHDFFNILTVLILFPLEYQFGLLSKSAMGITSFFSFDESPKPSGSFFFVDFSLVAPVSGFIMEKIGNTWIVIVMAFGSLFITIKIISNLLYKYLIGETKEQLKQWVFRSKISAFSWGVLSTATVQSSSITTPLVVPLVATNKISLAKAFNFLMGANIGTTITALLAASFKSSAALNIAIVHFLFNIIGVLIFLPKTGLHKFPVFLASLLGKQTKKYRIAGLIYIIFTFFLLPFTLIYFNQDTEEEIKDTNSIEEVAPKDPEIINY